MLDQDAPYYGFHCWACHDYDGQDLWESPKGDLRPKIDEHLERVMAKVAMSMAPSTQVDSYEGTAWQVALTREDYRVLATVVHELVDARTPGGDAS